MPDPTLEVQQAAPHRLAALLELVMTPGGGWQREELHAILQGRLNPSQPPPEEDANSESHPPLEEFILAGDLEIQTLQELFSGADPSLELLRQAKDFAKAHLEHPGSAWPSEVARMIYYAAIAAALVRRHARITRMAPEEIQRALQWGLAQPWATPSLRDLFQEAVHFLAAR